MSAILSHIQDERLAVLAEDLATSPADALVRVIDAGLAEMSRRVPTVSDLLDDVARMTGVSRAELVGPSRLKTITAARHHAMRCMRDLGYSFPEIGRAFNRDHTTAISACRKAVA